MQNTLIVLLLPGTSPKGSISYFSYLWKCHLIREAFTVYSYKRASPLPLSYLLPLFFSALLLFILLSSFFSILPVYLFIIILLPRMKSTDHKGKNFFKSRHCCIFHGCPKQCLVPSRHSINIGLIHG